MKKSIIIDREKTLLRNSFDFVYPVLYRLANPFRYSSINGRFQPLLRSHAVVQPFILLLCCLFFKGFVCAQSSSTIKASLNRNRVLIGEPIELKVEVNTTIDHPVTKWFNLADTFNHLEILNRSALDSVVKASVKTYHQSFTITGFDSGIWVIPALPVVINKKKITSDSFTVVIVPVQLKDSTYHDIREIIDIPDEKTPWWYWVAGMLSLIALGVLVWLWLKSRPGKRLAAAVNITRLSALEEAMNNLRQLEAKQLPDKEEWKKYYSELTGIFKVYIERKFKTTALPKTTSELLLNLTSRLNKQALSEVAEALRISDAVKFAKYQPGKDQSVLSLHTIEKTMEELDHLK